MDNVIKINIKKREDYTSKFNDDILSKELDDYIMNECKKFDIKENFDIEIYSEYDMDEIEKNKIIDMIRSNFGVEISEKIDRRKKAIRIDIITILFAVIALTFYILSSDIPILSEFILVFSWVLIWESTYNLLFVGFSNKIDIERRKKLTNCKIEFK